MRLGIIGEGLIERIIARTNIAPAPLLETQIAYSMARTIMAGVKLGIYDAIGAGAATPADVAAACGTDEEATTKLMNALVGCRYLRHRGGRYELTRKARKWMLRDSPNSIVDKLLFQYDEWDIVAQYEDYVMTGQPLDVHGPVSDRSAWDRYQRGKINVHAKDDVRADTAFGECTKAEAALRPAAPPRPLSALSGTSSGPT